MLEDKAIQNILVKRWEALKDEEKAAFIVGAFSDKEITENVTDTGTTYLMNGKPIPSLSLDIIRDVEVNLTQKQKDAYISRLSAAVSTVVYSGKTQTYINEHSEEIATLFYYHMVTASKDMRGDALMSILVTE